MRIIFTAVLIGLFTSNLPGQSPVFEKPDYKKIKKIVDNKNTPDYYTNLFDRYLKADTTIDLQDCRILYYGYLFNKSYKTYPISDSQDSLLAILKKDTITINDWPKLIKYEKQFLEEAPFNLRDLNILSSAYLQCGDTLSSIITDIKMNMVIGAILSSGNGLKESTAWHVISISHEYDILGILGFQFGGQQSLTNNGCDYLKVVENEHKIEGFYFDVNQILEKESEAFK